MNKRLLLGAPLALLTLAALACGGGTSTNGTADGPSALYRDDFSDDKSGWCGASDETGSVDYVSGKYVFEVTISDYYTWCIPGEKFDDVHVEVTAENSGGTPDSTFGLICKYQDEDNFYYAGVDSNGASVIGMYENNENSILDSGEVAGLDAEAASYKVAFECNNGDLTLSIDGDQELSASDDTFSDGDVGLFVWTAEELPAEIRFDNFVVTAP